MKFFFVTLLTIINLNICWAQLNEREFQAKLDGAKHDTIKVRLLLEYYDKHHDFYPEKSLRKVNEAAELARINDLPLYEAGAFSRMGNFYLSHEVNKEGAIEKGKEYYLQALNIYEKEGSTRKKMEVLQDLGSVAYYLEDQIAVVKYNLQALKIAKNLLDKQAILECYAVLDQAYGKMGEKEQSLEYAIKEYSLRNEDDSGDEHAVTLMEIGYIICSKRGFHEKGLKYLRESYALFKELGDSTSMNYVGERIEEVLGKIEKEEEAVLVSDKALSRYLKSLDLYQGLGDKPRMIGVLRNIVSYCFDERKDYNQAIAYAKKTLRVAGEIKDRESEAFAYIMLSKSYEQKGDYEQAYTYFSHSKKLYDQLANEYNIKEIAELEAEQKRKELTLLSKDKALLSKANEVQRLELSQAIAEQEKKQQELAVLSRENEIQQLKIRQKNQFVYGLIGVVILVIIIGFVIVRQGRLKRQQIKLELEQRALRSQMNPHFIFNALTSIQNFIYESDKEMSAAYLGKFARLMRIILENSREEWVTVQSEVDTLEYYLSLEQLRFKNKFDYEIKIEGSIDAEELHIPPMFLQPFVENAVLHAFKGVDYKGSIRAVFSKENNILVVIIADNGVGKGPAGELKENKTHQSLGLQLIQERMELFNRKQKNNISIRSAEGEKGQGTKIEVILPVLSDN